MLGHRGSVVIIAWGALVGCAGADPGASDASDAVVATDTAGTDAAGTDAAETDAAGTDAAETDAEPGPEVSDAGPIQVVTMTTQRPAPAELLYARLEGDGLGASVSVGGIQRGAPVLLDQDDAPDTRFPFAVVARDAAGHEFFRRTLREPIQIREFLGAAKVADIVDVFTLFPELGDFVVAIPSALPADAHIAFERRELDGHLTPLGDFALADLPDMPANPFAAAPHRLLAGASDPADAVDIVILGDGYTAADLDRFHADADTVAGALMALEPYASFAHHINIHRVDVLSHEAGASYDCSNDQTVVGCRDAFRDTAFGSVFPLRLGTLAGLTVSDRALIQRDQWAVAQAASVVPFDAVIVIVNTQKMGGFGLYRASTCNDQDLGQTAIHEFEHAFGLLGDEYMADGDICQHYALTPDYPNVSPLVADASAVPWAYWLTPGVPIPTPADAAHADLVGLFQGAGGGCADLYRPVAEACLMRNYDVPLCPVCRDQVLTRIFQHVDVLAATPVAVSGTTLVAVPGDDPIAGEWRLDGAYVGPAADASGTPLPLELAGLATSGRHTLVMRAQLLSPLLSHPEALSEHAELTVDFDPTRAARP